MSTEIMQFNSEPHIFGNRNVTEAVTTNGDIVYNESYIVIGESLEARNIYATYDLDVITDIYAEKVSVNGNLFVKGDIEADEIICHGKFICTGDVKVKRCNFDSNSMVGSIVGEKLYTGGDLFARTTVDMDDSLEVEGLVVAGEGIMGDGLFRAKAAIVNEYFEFTGKSESKVFEISEMDFFEPTEFVGNGADSDKMNINAATDLFNEVLNRSLDEWSAFEEEIFISRLRQAISSMSDLHFVGRMIDTVIGLSYKKKIDNFRDYLYVLCARNVFPDGLAKYETIEPVLEDMFNIATDKIDKMDYKASNADEFACSLYILNKYQDQLPTNMEDGADKIFSSIGLRYSTVEHAWRDYNG